jgi:hypothetical protein
MLYYRLLKQDIAGRSLNKYKYATQRILCFILHKSLLKRRSKFKAYWLRVFCPGLHFFL